MSISNTSQSSMKCKEFQRWLSGRDIHDAELPPDARAHMAGCGECRQIYLCDNGLEEAIKTGFKQIPLPEGLMDQISVSLDHQTASSPSPSGRSKVAEAAAAALACLVIILAAAYLPFSTQEGHKFKDLNQISLQAVKGHLTGNRQMNFRAEEVDQALAGLTKELGFQVRLPDFSAFGCTLLGGRLCALGDCRAAYFVLEKNGRAGSLFIMDTSFLTFDMADGSRFNTRIKGCEADVWKNNGQIYAMVF